MNKKLSFILGIIAAVLIVEVLLIILFRHQLGDFVSKSLDNISRQTFGFDLNIADPNVCEKLTNDNAKDVCYHMVAINLNNVFWCDSIVGQGQKDLCYSGFARQNENISLCQKISSQFEKDLCLSSFDDSQNP